MEAPPHAMLLGEDEGDYYRGTFSSRDRPATAGPGREA
jgi:hypothetical protein